MGNTNETQVWALKQGSSQKNKPSASSGLLLDHYETIFVKQKTQSNQFFILLSLPMVIQYHNLQLTYLSVCPKPD